MCRYRIWQQWEVELIHTISNRHGNKTWLWCWCRLIKPTRAAATCGSPCFNWHPFTTWGVEPCCPPCLCWCLTAGSRDWWPQLDLEWGENWKGPKFRWQFPTFNPNRNKVNKSSYCRSCDNSRSFYHMGSHWRWKGKSAFLFFFFFTCQFANTGNSLVAELLVLEETKK